MTDIPMQQLVLPLERGAVDGGWRQDHERQQTVGHFSGGGSFRSSLSASMSSGKADALDFTRIHGISADLGTQEDAMVAPFEGNACGHSDISTAVDVQSSRLALRELSKEQNINTLRSVELFSGCGGLALGTARAGFSHDMMVEWNEDACATLSLNKANGVLHAKDWNPRQGDVRAINWGMISGQLDLVAGGPPCQPFSVGGKARGSDDARDMWPEAIRAVRELRPRSFMFENVRGLTREAFKDYLGWIVASLARPSMVRNEDEDIAEHLARLTKGTTLAEYKVIVLSVNAADFGAAQKRHRVIVAGVRADLGLSLTPLAPTHSHERLLWEQWITGEYWNRHGLSVPTSGPSSIADRRIVDRLRATRMEPTLKAWRTVRDAIAGLGEPDGKNGHILQAGARVYPGHTGSPLDEPAKALKAGAHGVPGGENMLVKDDGSVRYFTIREAARLQGLPDDWTFATSWTESIRQLGNAVPTQLSEAAGQWMAKNLGGSC